MGRRENDIKAPDGASAGGLDLDELEKVARAAVDYFDRIKARGVMVSLDATPDDFLETFDPPTVLRMIAALRALSPSPGLGGSAGADIARTGTLPVLTSTPCQSEEDDMCGAISAIGGTARKPSIGKYHARNHAHLREVIAQLDAADMAQAADTLVWMVWWGDLYATRFYEWNDKLLAAEAALSSEAPSPKSEGA